MNKTKKKAFNPKSHNSALFIPNWLSQVSTKVISNGAKILYARLCQWSNESGVVYRSVKQLAEEIGEQPRTIDRLLKELKEVGLIGTYHPHPGSVNYFEFYEHDLMFEPIKKELCYKSENIEIIQSDPTTNIAPPPTLFVVTPTTKSVYININKDNKEITTTTAIVKDEQVSSLNEIPVVVVISKEIDKVLLQEKSKRPNLYANIDHVEFLKQCKFHLAGNDQDKHNLEGQLNGLIKIISKKEGGFKPPATYLNAIRLDKQRIENAVRLKQQDEDSRAKALKEALENNENPNKPKSTGYEDALKGIKDMLKGKTYSHEGEIQPC